MNTLQKQTGKNELFDDKSLMVTHLADITCLCIHEKTGIAATGSSEAFIRIWNIRKRQQIRVFEEITAMIGNLIFTQQGILISTSGNGKPLSWLTSRELINGTLLKQKFFYGKIIKISLTKAESALVIGISGNEINIVSTGNFEVLNNLITYSQMNLIISTNSYLVVGEDKGFKIRKISDSACSSVIPLKIANSTLVSAFEDVVIWTHDTEILYLDLNTKNSGQFRFHEFRIVAIAACGSKIASASSDCLVVLWDFALRSCIYKVKISAVVSNLAVLRDSDEIVCTDIYRSVWIADGNESFEFFVHKLEITCWSYSRDGSMIVTGSRDCSVRIWDLLSKSQLFVIQGHNLTVTCVSFSFSDRFVVSGSIDCSLISWDLKHKLINHVFTHHIEKILRIISFKTTQKILVLDKNSNISLVDLDSKKFVFLHNDDKGSKVSLTLSNNEKLCIISVNNLQTKVLKIS